MSSHDPLFKFDIGQVVCLKSDSGIRGPVVSRDSDGFEHQYGVFVYSREFRFSEARLAPTNEQFVEAKEEKMSGAQSSNSQGKDTDIDGPGAWQYLAKGESAIVVSTDGRLFQFDAEGNGFTGDWYIKGPQDAGKVMVFLREAGGTNNIYLADISHREGGIDGYRTRIHFRNCRLCGTSIMTWNQFSGVPFGKSVYSLQVTRG